MPDPVALLLNHFPDLTRLPGSVPELRKLILQRAVRGELTADWRKTHPDTEPASVLLEKIKAEKARLVKAGKIKKQQPLPEIGEDEVPFEVPEGWRLTRLGDSVQVLNGRAYGKNELLDQGTPVLRVGNLFTSNKWYYSDLTLEDDKYCQKGDLLYSWSASFGPFIWDGGKVIYHYHIWKLQQFFGREELKQYLYRFLYSETEAIKAQGHGISMVHMTKEKMELLLLPLPPLAEQQEIVARVERLLGLCDQLETAQMAEEAVRVRTRRASLAALDGGDTARAWHLVYDRFGTLIRTPEDVRELRKSILQLAVRGELTADWRRAHPDSEPASVLLEKIKAEKARLVKAGKIKKQQPLPEVGEDEVPFALPEGWVWARLREIIDPRFPLTYGVLVPGPDTEDGIPFVRVKDLSIKDASELPEKRISLEVEEKYKRTRLKGGEILLTVVGSIGKLGIAPKSWKGANIARAVSRVAPVEQIEKNYLVIVLQSDFIQSKFLESTRTLAQPTLNIGLIEKVVLGLPSVSEQQEIVARVEQLLGMCDRLETHLADAGETGARVWRALGAG